MGLALKQKNIDKKIPDGFLQLQQNLFILRPIHSKTAYNKALKVASDLALRTHLTREQLDYLEVLTGNIKTYEDRCFTPKKQSPLETLKFLVAENNMNASDLGRILGARTLGSAILSGRRDLSKTHIKKIADYFAVEPGLFL